VDNLRTCKLVKIDSMEFQTVLYEAESQHEKYGWKFGNVILFKSSISSDISQVMKEFNALSLPNSEWFAYVRVIDNGEIVEEEMFDSSVFKEY
jgi:hypothetical protein